jgi:hypothetical protein
MRRSEPPLRADFVAKVVDEHSKWPPQRIFLMWRLSVCRFEAAILMLR